MSKAGDIMLWNELFGKEHEPSNEQIAEFVDSPLWSDLAEHLQQTYNVKRKRLIAVALWTAAFGWVGT